VKSRLYALVLVTIALFAFAACGDGSTPPLETASPSPKAAGQQSRYNFYHLLRLLGADISETADILGISPEIVSDAGVYACEGVYFYADIDSFSKIVCITISPDMCEIDNISLDKNREELIDIFGTPMSEWYDEEGGPYFYNMILDFEIQRYFVRFGLRTPDEKSNFMKIFLSEPPQQYWQGR
jgi:hypothetical protein